MEYYVKKFPDYDHSQIRSLFEKYKIMYKIHINGCRIVRAISYDAHSIAFEKIPTFFNLFEDVYTQKNKYVYLIIQNLAIWIANVHKIEFQKQQLIHGDFVLKNIFISGRKVIIIDAEPDLAYEKKCDNRLTPERDIAYFIFSVLFDGIFFKKILRFPRSVYVAFHFYKQYNESSSRQIDGNVFLEELHNVLFVWKNDTAKIRTMRRAAKIYVVRVLFAIYVALHKFLIGFRSSRKQNF